MKVWRTKMQQSGRQEFYFNRNIRTKVTAKAGQRETQIKHQEN